MLYLIYGRYSKCFCKIDKIYEPDDSVLITCTNTTARLVKLDISNHRYYDGETRDHLEKTIYLVVPESKLNSIDKLPYIFSFDSDSSAELYFELTKNE